MGDFTNKRVLVTGGAGFIGSRLVERLLDLDNRVITIDNLSSGSLDNLPARSRKFGFIKGDVRNFKLVRKLAQKSDVIFHLADFIPNTKQVGPGHVVKFSMKAPLLDLDVCVRGTLNILEAARQTHASVVFASTAAVYGEPLENPVKETMPANPLSAYGTSKFAAEMYCKLFNKMHGLSVIIARIFNAYGPRQRKYVMHDFLLKLKRNPNNLKMLGSGNHVRDFIYVDDVVDGLVFLSVKKEACGQTLNLGTGVPTSIRKLVAYLAKAMGARPVITFTGVSWKGDIKTLVADLTQLKNMGYCPKYDLRQGIKDYLYWYRQVEE